MLFRMKNFHKINIFPRYQSHCSKLSVGQCAECAEWASTRSAHCHVMALKTTFFAAFMDFV